MTRAPKDLLDAAAAAAALIARLARPDLPQASYAECVRVYCDLNRALRDCRPDNEPVFRSTDFILKNERKGTPAAN